MGLIIDGGGFQGRSLDRATQQWFNRSRNNLGNVVDIPTQMWLDNDMNAYTTKKAQFPGVATLDAEFAAVATVEQAALRAGTEWASVDARRGIWALSDGSNDVAIFHRTSGEIEG